MKIIHLPPVAIGVGVLLIGVSFVWPRVIRTSTVWSDEQAGEYARAAAAVHRLAHVRMHAAEGDHQHKHGDRHGVACERHHGGGDNPARGAETFEEAKLRFDKSQRDLDSARAFRHGAAVLFKWTGILCMFVGVGSFYLLRAALD